MDRRAKGRLKLSCIIAVFIIPLGLAWHFYDSRILHESDKVNHGRLIQPPWKIQDYTKEGWPNIWSFIYVPKGDCQTQCKHALTTMRQVRLVLGKDQNRVRNMVLVTGKPEKILSDLLKDEFKNTKQLSIAPNNPFLADHIYVVDPLGNVILDYSGNIQPKAVLKDMQRLLKVSRVG